MSGTHFNVRHVVEIKKVEEIKRLEGFVVLGEAGCVDDRPDSVDDLPKRALEGGGSSGCRERERQRGVSCRLAHGHPITHGLCWDSEKMWMVASASTPIMSMHQSQSVWFVPPSESVAML